MSVYWIDLRGIHLGIMPRPRGNDWLVDDLRALKHAGVDVIASALTAPEAEELGLITEAEGCAQNGLLFIPFPIEDRSLPAHSGEFGVFVNKLLEQARTGGPRSSIVELE